MESWHIFIWKVMKEFKLSCGRYVRYFDDIIDLSTRLHFASFCQNSYYKLVASSRDDWESTKRFIASFFSKEEIEDSKFFYGEKVKKLIDTYIPNKELIRHLVVFSDLSSKVQMHYDGGFNLEGSVSLIYYVNMTWDPEWGGETLFANEKGEPEVIIPFTPGRIVIFDSKIPHRSTHVSPDSPWRLTFNAIYA